MKYNRSSVSHKLKIVSGQLDGLTKMIEEDQYCVDILTQSLAIQKALQKIDRDILKDHLKGCVVHQMTSGESSKAVEELNKIYSLSKRN